MPDEPVTQAAPTEARCTWCSAVLPDPAAATCPSCGATLIGDGETAGVPGLTSIDADAILRNARGTGRTKPRSGLLGWISGEYPVDESAVATPESLAPPTADVRREMLRLELEAQVANAQAEVEAMAADEAIAEGNAIPKDILNQEGLFEPPTIAEPDVEPAAATETPSGSEAAAAPAPDATEAAAESGDATPA
jgi:hypothetical protein